MYGDTEAATKTSKQMVGGYLEILEVQLRLRRSTDAQLPHRADNLESGHVRANQKRGRPLNLLPTPLQIRLGKSRNHTGTVGVADPDLPAIELPLRAVLAETGGRLDVLRVRSDLRLCQCIRGEILPASQRRQIALLLLIVSVKHDRLRAEPAVNADENGERRVDRRKRREYTRVRR